MRGVPASPVYENTFWPSTGRVNIAGCTGGRRVWSTVTLTNGIEYAMPLTIPTQTVIVAIGVQKGAGFGGALAHMGIRNVVAGTLKPGTLLIDGGELTYTAAAEIKWLTIDYTINPGRYWLTYVSDTAINNINGIEAPTYVDASYYGWSDSVVAADYPTVGWYCTQAYGALPASWSGVGETAMLSGATPPASFYYRV